MVKITPAIIASSVSIPSPSVSSIFPRITFNIRRFNNTPEITTWPKAEYVRLVRISSMNLVLATKRFILVPICYSWCRDTDIINGILETIQILFQLCFTLNFWFWFGTTSKGGRGLVLYKDGGEEDILQPENASNDDEEGGCIDASRLQQLLGKHQLFAAGLCATWILQNACKNPKAGLKDLLRLLDSQLDQEGGMSILLTQLKESNNDPNDALSKSMIQVLESVGYLERPRNFEVGQALTRMRGIKFEELPVYDDGSEEAARIEAENRKKALLAIWEARRSKKSTFASS